MSDNIEREIKREITRQKAYDLGKEYGGVAGQRAALNFQILVLSWILRFKFTTPEVIAELMGITDTTARDKLRKLVKKKLIAKVPSVTVHKNYIYMITPIGSQTLEHSVGRLGLPVFKSERVANRTLNVHDLCVQFYCARIFRTQSFGVVKKIYAESFFKKTNKLPKLKYRAANNGKEITFGCAPDAVVEFTDGTRVAVEYESQSKSVTKAAEKLIYHAIYMRMDDSFYQKTLYCFRYESSVKKYEQALNKYLKWAVPRKEYYEDGDDTTAPLCYNEPIRQAIKERFSFVSLKEFSTFHGGASDNTIPTV